MKALSFWQPWADAIVIGPKRIDNRTWKPPSALIGKTVAIHASQKLDPTFYDDTDQVSQRAREEHGLLDDVGGVRAFMIAAGWTPARCSSYTHRPHPRGPICRGCVECRRSALVGTARIVGYITTIDAGRGLFPDGVDVPPIEPLAKQWFIGPIGWVLSEIRRARTPVFCKGARGLWTLSADKCRALTQQLEEPA